VEPGGGDGEGIGQSWCGARAWGQRVVLGAGGGHVPHAVRR